MSTTSTKMDNPKHPQTPGSVPLPKMKRGLRTYMHDVSQEMKKVTWPKPAETNRLTWVVIAVCLFTVAYLTGLGYLIQTLFDILFRRQ